MLGFLYAPLVPPVLRSLEPAGGEGGITLDAYASLLDNPLLPSSVQATALAGLLTAVVATLLGLLGALAVRELPMARLVLTVLLVPLFIPGVSMGLADAFFFQQLGVDPSLLTIVLVQVLWALPFAVVIILTTMASFDEIYLEAAYVHGANRLRAFRDIELPHLSAGLAGTFVFSFILSINETIRTQLVQGPFNTIQTYIYSTYLQVGVSPTVYAVMSLLILTSVGLFAVLLVRGILARSALRGAGA